MPHIVLETSLNLEGRFSIPEILTSLVKSLSQQPTVNPAAIKAYHRQSLDWVMGAGAPEGFVHCTIELLSGRPPELKAAMSKAFFAILNQEFDSLIKRGECGVTVEVRDMEAESYCK